MENSKNNLLEKVRKIEQNGFSQISAESRPVYHLSSPMGWMNDPNGFSVYKKDYHLFFQYHPFSNEWGPMHWGHCKSTDFIKWDYLPIAMAPDQSYDEGGCYSGSALQEGEEHILFYTGVIDHYLDDGSHHYSQVQCIAKGDGINYKKYQGNPVITGLDLPPGSNIKEFRDPKVWKEGTTYYLIAGNQDEDGYGQVLLFQSDNLKKWNFLNVLDKSNGEYGKMWECPDFFSLEDTQILLVSPQNMRAKGYEFHNGNNSMFIYGDYNNTTYQFKRKKIFSADYGLDFYAPQTLLTSDGRRIMIGWMQSWDAKFMKDFLNWSGMMTIPRELQIKNEKIYQSPVRELENYHKNLIKYEQCKITEAVTLKGIKGRVIDLQVKLTEFNFHHFTIHFAHNEEYEMLLQYNHRRKCLTVDRTHSELLRDVVCRRKMDVEPIMEEQKEVLKLRLLLDKHSIEVFINDGEKVMTSVFYAPIEADEIIFDTDGIASIDVIKYDICI